MWKWIIYNIVLFIAFLPGMIVTLPPSGSKMTVAVVHAILFAIVHKLGARYVKHYEFFEDMPNTNVPAVCRSGETLDYKGECRLP